MKDRKEGGRYRTRRWDALADLTRTAEGALLTYAEGSSLLLRGVDADDLSAAHFVVEEIYGAIMY